MMDSESLFHAVKRPSVKAKSTTKNYASFLAKRLTLTVSVRMQENLHTGMF